MLPSDEDDDVSVLAASKEKNVLIETNAGSAVYSTPILANGVLYISSKSQLFAIQAPQK